MTTAAMTIELAERVGRGVAAVIGLGVLVVGIMTPTWWGALGALPVVIALTGW